MIHAAASFVKEAAHGVASFVAYLASDTENIENLRSSSLTPSAESSQAYSSSDTVPDLEQRIDEWKAGVMIDIHAFAQEVKENKSTTTACKNYAIAITYSESWNYINQKLKEIGTSYKNNFSTEADFVIEWIIEWTELIKAIELACGTLKLQQQYLNNLQELRDLSRTPEHYSTAINHALPAYAESKESLNRKLQAARQKITGQLHNDKYHLPSIKMLLDFMDMHWEALIIFSQSPDLSIDKRGLSCEFSERKIVCDLTPYLNISRPAFLLIDGRTLSVEVVTAPHLPEGRRAKVEEIISILAEDLKQYNIPPSPEHRQSPIYTQAT